MDGLLRSLERLPRAAVYALAVSFIAVVALVDWISGEEISVSFFYALPILLVTWLYGLAPGLVLNAFCASFRLFHVARSQGPDLFSRPALYWNLAIEGAFVLTLTFIVSALRTEHARQSLLARTDPLTGIANRRGFYERAELELSRSRRHDEAITLGYVDVDDFKRINDELGHEAGDDLLRVVATTFVGRVRSTDLVARLGGDEFALLLSATGAEAARALFAELKETLTAEMATHSWPVTFSIGAVTFLETPIQVDDMLRRVDELMYHVKRKGKAGVLFDVLSAPPGRLKASFRAEEKTPA